MEKDLVQQCNHWSLISNTTWFFDHRQWQLLDPQLHGITWVSLNHGAITILHPWVLELNPRPTCLRITGGPWPPENCMQVLLEAKKKVLLEVKKAFWMLGLYSFDLYWYQEDCKGQWIMKLSCDICTTKKTFEKQKFCIITWHLKIVFKDLEVLQLLKGLIIIKISKNSGQIFKLK